MRNSLLFFLLAFLTLTTSAFAQTTEEEANEDLDYYNNSNAQDFENGGGNLWFGTGAILGFGSNQIESNFIIGLTPIVGYRLNNWLSVGPRAGLTYNRTRFSNFNGSPDLKISFVEWSAGPFARAQVFRGIFAHAEYNVTSEAIGLDANDNVLRNTRFIPFAGAGLQQGGGPGQVGFEILLLFRISGADTVGDRPFEFRTGINWNF